MATDKQAFVETLESRIQKVLSNMELASDVWGPHKSFADSILEYFNSKGRLSESQLSYLKRIEERYSDESLNEESEWSKKYHEVRDLAYKMATYYKYSPVPYFSDIVRKVMDDPEGHVLTKREFTKICMNKYSEKVMDTYRAKPKYKKGQIVEMRVSHRIDLVPWNKLDYTTIRQKISAPTEAGQMVGIVTNVDCKPITRASKGAKIYQVLFPGLIPLYVHESDIKKGKKR